MKALRQVDAAQPGTKIKSTQLIRCPELAVGKNVETHSFSDPRNIAMGADPESSTCAKGFRQKGVVIPTGVG